MFCVALNVFAFYETVRGIIVFNGSFCICCFSGVVQSSRNTLEKWSKQILHIWAPSKHVANVVTQAYDLVSDSVRANTVVLVTTTHNAPEIFTNKWLEKNKSPYLLFLLKMGVLGFNCPLLSGPPSCQRSCVQHLYPCAQERRQKEVGHWRTVRTCESKHIHWENCRLLNETFLCLVWFQLLVF